MESDSKAAAIYDEIIRAVGDVCYWWVAIEDVIFGLSLHLACYVDDAFERPIPWQVFRIALTNTDIRSKIATTKALAHAVDSKGSPDFFERVESLLNFVDSTLRSERNRYVHDTWSVDNSDYTVSRAKPGAIVRRAPGSGSRKLTFDVARHFGSPDEIKRFVEALRLAYDDLAVLDGHIAWLTGQKEQPSAHRQPLPPVWTSFAHRDWLEKGRP